MSHIVCLIHDDNRSFERNTVLNLFYPAAGVVTLLCSSLSTPVFAISYVRTGLIMLVSLHFTKIALFMDSWDVKTKFLSLSNLIAPKPTNFENQFWYYIFLLSLDYMVIVFGNCNWSTSVLATKLHRPRKGIWRSSSQAPICPPVCLPHTVEGFSLLNIKLGSLNITFLKYLVWLGIESKFTVSAADRQTADRSQPVTMSK